MRGFYIMNTPMEQVPFGYANAEFNSGVGTLDETEQWEDEQEDWNGCCEDPYEDEEEEENEREWCD